MKKIIAEILENRKIAEDHYVLSLKSQHLRGAKPGQLVNVRCGATSVPLLRRPFGVHRKTKDGIEILYKVIGKGTGILSKKKKKEKLDVLGPLGKGFVLPVNPSKKEEAILVAGGHGVAPLYALAEELIKEKMNVSVFIGARQKKHVVLDRDFKKLSVKTYVATEDGSKGFKGLVTELLKNKLKGVSRGQSKTIYACGPRPMLKSVSELADMYVYPCQISLEEYIGCGIGICMGCAVQTRSGTKLVCKDGPVFNSREIIW